MDWGALKDGAAFGAWQVVRSKSTGLLYFFHPHTGEAVWYDPALPAGWGFQWAGVGSMGAGAAGSSGGGEVGAAPRRAERTLGSIQAGADVQAGSGNKKRYVNLLDGNKVDVAPTAAAAPMRDDGEARENKRPRMAEGIAATQANTNANVTAAPAPAPAQTRTAAQSAPASGPGTVAAPLPPSKPHPRMRPEELRMGRPDEKPAVPTRKDGSAVSTTGGKAAAPGVTTIASPFFAEPHKLVLRQVLTCAYEAQRRKVEFLKASGAYDEWVTPTLTCFDVGAGLGAVTQYLLQVVPENAAVVYAIDSCATAYYVESLRDATQTELVEYVEREMPDTWAQMLLNFWDDDSVTPMRYPARAAMVTLKRIDVQPQIVYIDADLHYEETKALLEFLIAQFPDAWIVGGGWNVSEGVRRAVSEVSIAAQKPLHVEQETAWTFSGNLVTITANKAVAVSEEAAAAADRLRVKNDAMELDSVRRQWFNDVAAILAESDDVAALRKAVGDHGRGPGTDPAMCWIDDGGEDKRHLTLLMHAARSRRTKCVQALVDEFGANVNVQAERSGFTAIGLAAYSGAMDVVQFLLHRGANPRLVNKFGEDAIKNALQKNHTAIAKLLEAHV